MPTIRTGVGCIICASHLSVDRKKTHGHTWEITAWFGKVENADRLKQELAEVCQRYDHTILDAKVAWGEALATEILERLKDWNCVEVEVSRSRERIYAKATA